jgi:hypothetical protein
LFFLDVASAQVIGALDLKPWMVQIITVHCALNAHQYSFGFLTDPVCSCGDKSESVEHFVCPLYDQAGFKTQSMAELSQWPPPLHSIPQSPILWAEFTRFISRTKRLLFSLARVRPFGSLS